MRTPSTTSARGAANKWCAGLRRHDFKLSADGWRKGQLTFQDRHGWLVFTAPWLETLDPLHALGALGLWKPVRDEQQGHRVFAVHESWLHDEDDLFLDEGRSGFDYIVEWALATEGGALPNGWTVPDVTVLQACLNKTRRTLTHGSFTRQMQILHAPDRLGLRLPILITIPANLPAARRCWLRTLLLEAQNTHHLFRVGFVQEGAQTSALAEIDLTGVPSQLLEPLLSKSCDALRWVVAWLIESADFLARADAASRALEICAALKPNP